VFIPYLKENTKTVHYKDEIFNAVEGNNPCLQRESNENNEYKRQC